MISFASLGIWLVLVVALVAALSLILLFVSDRAVRGQLSRVLPRSGVRPFISVLKPMKGCDDELYENLVAFASQRYPGFELLFGIADWDDPAHLVARRVKREFPDCKISIHICTSRRGLNPKVNILSELSRRARSDLVLISDSNVRPGPSYLEEMARQLSEPGVGLVTHLIAGVDEQSPGATFENVHSLSYVARAVTVARVVLRRACVVGKSMLFRYSDLERLGGWAAVEDLLAEDYVIGRMFEQAGQRVVLSPVPLFTVNQKWSVARFVNRHMRWGQMRRRISLSAYALEILFNPIPLLLGLGALSVAFCPDGFQFFVLGAALGVVAKVLADLSLLKSARGQALGWRELWCLPCKDLLVAVIWAAAWLHRTIDWRGNLFRVGAGTRLAPHAAPAWQMALAALRRKRRPMGQPA